MGETPIRERRGAQFFRDDVDPSTCYDCGGTEPDVIHHVSYNPEVTVPVCYSCHSTIHRSEEHELDPGEKRDIGESGTQSITATLPTRTVRWLRDAYPDATSDSQRLGMAVSDARLVREAEVERGGGR